MRIQPLLPAFEVHRNPPLNYDDMFPGKEAFIRTRESFPAVNLYQVADARVSPYGVVFKNGRVLPESVYGMFKPASQWPSFLKKILLGKTRVLPDPVLVVHHAYYENYYHWLCEIMPRLFISATHLQQEGLSLLMHARQPRFVREYLDLFGGKRIDLPDDALARAPAVFFPSHIARPLAYHEGVMRDMGAWLRERLNDSTATNCPEKLFISRKQARYRITQNEAEIEQYLQSKGFVSVAPEMYSVREQMNLFKRARVIIGSHGAGFANLLFAPACELVVDIIHREHPQDCFYNLAAALGSGYFYFQCAGTGRLNYKNNDDIVVDAGRFKQEVGKLLR